MSSQGSKSLRNDGHSETVVAVMIWNHFHDVFKAACES